MKKTYQHPCIKQTNNDTLQPIAQSLTGNTGNGTIGSGNEDTEGDGDPDSKHRGFDDWGSLW